MIYAGNGDGTFAATPFYSIPITGYTILFGNSGM